MKNQNEHAARGHILEQAKSIINGARQDEYGTPENSFEAIAAFWSTYKGVEFSAHDVAMMMALLKSSPAAGRPIPMSICAAMRRWLRIWLRGGSSIRASLRTRHSMPPKSKKIPARTNGRPREVSAELLEEISVMKTRKDVVCAVCHHPDVADIEMRLLEMQDGQTHFAELEALAEKYGVSRHQLRYHRERCMLYKVAESLDKNTGTGKGTAMKDGAYFIQRLGDYLLKADDVIQRAELGKDDKLLLSAVEQARKICDTNTRLFIEVYKLQLDKKVQDDFRKIVLEVIERCAPEARDRIVAELKRRYQLVTALGGTGV